MIPSEQAQPPVDNDQYDLTQQTMDFSKEDVPQFPYPKYFKLLSPHDLNDIVGVALQERADKFTVLLKGRKPADIELCETPEAVRIYSKGELSETKEMEVSNLLVAWGFDDVPITDDENEEASEPGLQAAAGEPEAVESVDDVGTVQGSTDAPAGVDGSVGDTTAPNPTDEPVVNEAQTEQKFNEGQTD